jgi:hypothetical protein
MKTVTYSDLTSRRLQLLEQGYSILPTIHKVPAIGGWNAPDYVQHHISAGKRGSAAALVESWERRFPRSQSTGVRIENGLGVIDADVDDAAAIDAILGMLKTIAPEVYARAPTRYGGGAKMALFMRPAGEAFTRIASRKYRRPGDGPDQYHCIEIFGGKPFKSGVCSRQFACYGPRSDTTDYVWDEGVQALHEVNIGDLPAMSRAQAYDLLAAFEHWAEGAAGWVRVVDIDEGDGEGVDIYDIEPDSKFEVDADVVDLAGLEEMYHARSDLRCTANFIAGENSITIDRCSVFWSNRYSCLVIKDWKTNARHYPVEHKPVEGEAIAGAIGELAADSGMLLPADTKMPPKAKIDDFYAFLPKHTYIYRHTGEMWLITGINTTVDRVVVGVDKDGVPVTVPAALWLDRHRAVMQMTWAPGRPQLILDQVTSEGGWRPQEGAAIFNSYRPAEPATGKPINAARWIELIETIYPDHVDHILGFFAHRRQKPAEKINHALVLGGAPGIGKDTILEPLKRAVGAWNFKEISPLNISGANTDFMQSTVLRVSETRDLGETSRYSFYETTKTMIAAPPDMVRINIKHVPQFYIPNVTAVIFTTNYGADGLFLPPDDRRHYVCGSEVTQEHFDANYFREMWAWYEAGGINDVVAYLDVYDLADFNAKAPPEKTAAFWRMVDAGRASEEPEFREALERAGNPLAVTISILTQHAGPDLGEWIRDRKNRRNIPRRMDACGFVPVRNAGSLDGSWKIGGRSQAIYGQKSLSVGDRYRAAERLKIAEDDHADKMKGNVTPFKPL